MSANTNSTPSVNHKQSPIQVFVIGDTRFKAYRLGTYWLRDMTSGKHYEFPDAGRRMDFIQVMRAISEAQEAA